MLSQAVVHINLKFYEDHLLVSQIVKESVDLKFLLQTKCKIHKKLLPFTISVFLGRCTKTNPAHI